MANGQGPRANGRFAYGQKLMANGQKLLADRRPWYIFLKRMKEMMTSVTGIIPNVLSLRTLLKKKKTIHWIEHVKGSTEDNTEQDDIRLGDSASDHNSITNRSKKAGSSNTRLSKTSSARLRLEAEAEREALMAQAASMKRRQEIELEEAHLKAQKEQLELDTKIAASNAKIKVYAEYEGGQDGMNDYFRSKDSYVSGVKATQTVKEKK